jgi:hypothetical protein
MKANGKFFKFSFILNFILGAVGFLILWGVRALTENSIVGIIICSVIFLAIALYINIFIVKKSKLLIPYFIFGTVVNAITVALPTMLMMVL